MKLKSYFAGLVLAFAACASWAQTLTPAQIITVRAAACADTATARPMMLAGDANALSAWLNSNSTFIAWRSDVRADEIGNAWLGTDIDGMSALNMQRLQLLLASSPEGLFDMTRADRRAGFEGPFGTNANNGSRVAMRAAWKRPATQAERALATGTGTDAAPGVLTFTGSVQQSQATSIVYRDNGTLWGC